MLVVSFNVKQLHIFIEPLASHFISPDQLLLLLLKVFFFERELSRFFFFFFLETDTCPLTSSQTTALLRAVFSIPCCLYSHTQFAAGLLGKAATSTSSLLSCCLFWEHQHPDHGRPSPTFTVWCGDTFVDRSVTKT